MFYKPQLVLPLLLCSIGFVPTSLAKDLSPEERYKNVPYFKLCHSEPTPEELPPPDLELRTYKRLPPDELVDIHIESTDTYYKIPAKYVGGDERDRGKISKITEKDTLRFSFPLANIHNYKGKYPFIMSVRFLTDPPPPTLSSQDFMKSERKIVTPEQQYVNGFEHWARYHDYPLRETPAFGAIQVVSATDEEIRQRNFLGEPTRTRTEHLSQIEYRNIPGSNIQFFLTCDCLSGQGYKQRRICRGEVLFVKERLEAFVLFPREAMPRWHEILTTMRDLIFSWEVPPPKEKTHPEPAKSYWDRFLNFFRPLMNSEQKP